jgi:hypothetical protein
MIFHKTWRQVLGGTKTQTRRLVKEGDYGWACGDNGKLPPDLRLMHSTVHQANHRLRWARGNTYAVQPGRGKKSVGRFRLTGIRWERLQEISGRDVMAEGCWTGDEFIRLWDSIHRKGNRWADNRPVWVLEFELC